MASFVSWQQTAFENRHQEDKAGLAEILGIMLGDGGLYFHKRKGLYHSIVAFNKKETQYRDYVRELFGRYFHPYRFQIVELEHEFFVRNISVFVGQYLIRHGLVAGNKTQLQVTVPYWILSDRQFMIRCVRGLFDTDGCVYRKYGPYAQIQFKFASRPLTIALREMLVRIGFSPTNVKRTPCKQFMHWKFYISNQGDIHTFMALIQPKNKKHVDRYDIYGRARI